MSNQIGDLLVISIGNEFASYTLFYIIALEVSKIAEEDVLAF
jgi:hypothetical protein